ncbi:hypothetical protein Sphch_3154 [Sphingobium chlorophenolicum L-1]|uniref:Uncharacterized protein n=1 Tax=Sphingobium chlorophenolicum L-1 TaxID=690566 RepID=F6F2V7_SPHCR|nr:hypothetical protein [Sphingobium chlorophenolicum]AEG50769.1 hypothetical protein Sphch_3154 [Sphingobium chlorophenolicum L-1]
MTISNIDNLTWDDALSAVNAAYAAAADIGASHPPGSVREKEFTAAAVGIAHAIERLIVVPAPDFASVRTKLDLLAQEFDGGDGEQLQMIAQDLHRLADIGGDAFDADAWLRDFEAVGGGFIVKPEGVEICVMLAGYPPSANWEAKRLLDEIERDEARRSVVVALIKARNPALRQEGEGA